MNMKNYLEYKIKMIKDPFENNNNLSQFPREEILKLEKNISENCIGEFIFDVNTGFFYERRVFMQKKFENKSFDLVDVNNVIFPNISLFSSIIRINPSNLPEQYRVYRLYQK